MLGKIFILPIIIAGTACMGVYSFPQFGRIISRTIDCVVASGSTEVGLGWSLKENPAEAVKEAVRMALKDKRNQNPNVAIMFAKTGNNISAIRSGAKKILNYKTKLYGGSSDPEALINNKGYVYIKKAPSGKKIVEEKRGIVAITISSREVAFGVGSSDLSESHSVRNAAKTATLRAIENSGKRNGKRPKLVFLMSTPSSENEAVRGAKEVLDRTYIILCGSAEKGAFSIFAEKNVYTSGVSVAVVYISLPIGLNIIKRSYAKIKMPRAIKSLLALRLNVEKA